MALILLHAEDMVLVPVEYLDGLGTEVKQRRTKPHFNVLVIPIKLGVNFTMPTYIVTNVVHPLVCNIITVGMCM
jgi:hypothetical protein